jgi:hypothetical protein
MLIDYLPIIRQCLNKGHEQQKKVVLDSENHHCTQGFELSVVSSTETKSASSLAKEKGAKSTYLLLSPFVYRRLDLRRA